MRIEEVRGHESIIRSIVRALEGRYSLSFPDERATDDMHMIIFWGEPMDELVRKVRANMTLPDLGDSATCQAALVRMAHDLEHQAVVPWALYAEKHKDYRALGRAKEKNDRHFVLGEEVLNAVETIIRYAEESGEDFKNLRRDGVPNKPLAILCALLWVSGEGR